MTLLVHNSAYANEAQADDWWPDLQSWTWWNLWRVRAMPYHELEDGSEIVLLQSWPRGGRLTHLVRAHDVLKASFGSWEDAVDALVGWSGLDPEQVRQEPYTAERRTSTPPLYLLAWRARLLQELDLPRPEGLVLRRNGWASFTEDEAAALGLDQLRTADPRRRGADAERNRALELYAVDRAIAWCEERGWNDAHHVGDDGLPWDVEAVDRYGCTRFVEVKGTSGPGRSLTVTRNEVEAAREHGSRHALVHVRDVKSVWDEGRWRCSGGTLVAYDPWLPVRRELREETYSWGRPATSDHVQDQGRSGALVPDVRLPGYGGAALTLKATSSCEGWQDDGDTGPVLDIGLLDPSRYLQQLARPCDRNALERLATFLLAAAADRYPEQTVASYQDLSLGLGLSVVGSDDLTVELDVVVTDEPGGDALDSDATNFRTSRAAVVAAAHQASELAERQG